MSPLVPLSLVVTLAACGRTAPGSPPRGPDAAPPGRWSALWVNEGGDKVARGELRASSGRGVTNMAWDGRSVALFAARNEIVSFQIILEAAAAPVEGVQVELASLEGPEGRALHSGSGEVGEIFDWRQRQIELFRVGYLPLLGLSRTTWELYDERHIPERLRRPIGFRGRGSGDWEDRPDHDAEYPDIAEPLEVVGAFDIAAGTSQAVWVDVTVPRDAPAGVWRGELRVRASSAPAEERVPVELLVLDFGLPDEPAAQTMVYTGHADLAARYLGHPAAQDAQERDRARLIRDRHHLLARRHRVTLFDANLGSEPGVPLRDAPTEEWVPRLDGTLFLPDNGYAGPGEGVGNGLFVIGAYGSWPWQTEDREGMWRHLDGWARWFRVHAPATEVLLYLVDESADFETIERWASWMHEDPGPGRAIRSFATLDLPDAVERTPSLDVPASSLAVADTERWSAAVRALRDRPGARLVLYNGRRPASGTFALEDDGVALRELPWGQQKLGVDRWFFWESTYYTDVQGGGGATDVFAQARTFGRAGERDDALGETGWRYTNGDGVLFYPGTDHVFPDHSLGVEGPLASLRLKHWRRGIQDAAYLALARAVDPDATQAIVDAMVPRVLWEVGVDDPEDPSWKRTDISWPTDPDTWERARWRLAGIISRPRPASPGAGDGD
ncbi:MAG: DUF4091 domain-containing protein [Deltaproteobacteria bacterium]|nr:DUF4091 domain-containing protein [Deltaproteobacteria bacterium]MCB9788874.1 DUF4091 domain-containing protein [Deltaproteobacteria bacterium]